MPDATGGAFPLELDPARTALLVLDYQVVPLALLGDGAGAVLKTAGACMDAAREAGLLVVHVTIALREGYPEVSERNRILARIKRASDMLEGSEAAAIHPAVAPRPGDAVIVKRRVGSLFGSDLGTILRARNIDTLVMFGIATHGVVLSTLCECADLDYRIAVIGDLCGDPDPDVDEVLLERVIPHYGSVTTASALLATLAQRA